MANHRSSIESAGLVSTSLINVKTGLEYDLVRADRLVPSEENLRAICAICNEPEIYELLFRSMLQGRPYVPENAQGFLERARSGWKEETHFVFLVTTPQGEVAGALDIKSRNARAEIGYWASSAHAGIMTPAVQRLCGMAADSGFETLFAFVKTTNLRSSAVLERNGFRKAPSVDATKSYPRFLFEKRL